MKTLWTFGDSFTDYFTPPNYQSEHWRHRYIKWKGYTPKVYGEIIAEMLGMKLINKGVGGCDNSFILEEFCKVCDKIKKDDIIVFGWTAIERFRLIDKNNIWGFFNLEVRNKSGFFAHSPLNNFDFLSEKTIQEMLVNRSSIHYVLELKNWIKLINFTLSEQTVIHWSWDQRIATSGAAYFGKFKTIKEETNDEVNDCHWCEDGHKEFANILIDKIQGKQNVTNRKII